MVKSMYAGVAGMRAHQQWLDVIGNNIANCNTYGYKSNDLSFQDALYQMIASSQGGVTTQGGYGGTNPSQVGYGTEVQAITTDYSGGGVAPSNNPLDCMINGSGFFLVGTFKGGEDGGDEGFVTDGAWTDTENYTGFHGKLNVENAGLSLTRVGRFQIDDNGYLTDVNGNYIYGFQNTSTDEADGPAYGTDLGLIRLPGSEEGGGDNANNIYSSYAVKADGTVIATTDDKRTIIVGKVAIASVQNASGLEKGTGGYYTIGDNCGSVDVVSAGGAAGRIIGNALEMSNVDLAIDFTNMIKAQRGYQANSKIISVTDQMLEELVNIKR